jgi:hypothetical protein
MARVGDWIEKQRETEHSIAATHVSVVRAAIVHALGAPEEAFCRIGVAPMTLTDLRLVHLAAKHNQHPNKVRFYSRQGQVVAPS